MIEFDYETHSGTHFTVRFYLLMFGVSAVIGAFFLFFAPFDVENFIVPGYILFTGSLVYGIVALLKCLVVFIHKKCETKKSTQFRNEILIGLGGIAICGIVPRILVFFATSLDDFLVSSTFLSVVISIALYYLFVYECDKSYKSNSDAISNEALYLFGLHVVALLVIIKFVLICDIDASKKIGIIVYQFLVGFYYSPTTFDLYGVLSGLRKLKNVDEVEKPIGNSEHFRREPVIVAPEAEKAPSLERETCKNQESKTAQTHPKIDCKVCRVEYSDIRIPRTLNGCGHTICEVCVNTLLNTKQSVICPFCKITTEVNGPASTLQKNYGILEVINDLKH